MKLQTVVKCALEISEDALDQFEVRLTRVVDVEVNLLNRISDIRTRKS